MLGSFYNKLLFNPSNPQKTMEDTSIIVCNKDFYILSSVLHANFSEINIFFDNIYEGIKIIDVIKEEELPDFLFYSSKALKGETVHIKKVINSKSEKVIEIIFEPYLEKHFIHGFILRIKSSYTIPDPQLPSSSNIISRIEVLSDSEIKFRYLFEQAPFGLLILSLDLQEIVGNEKFYNILGYSPEELSKIDFEEIIHPQDLEEGKRHILSLINGEIDNYTTEKRCIHKNGQTFWIQGNCSIVKDKDLLPKFMVIMIQDISLTKNMELQLKEKAVTFRSMFKNAPVGMMQIDMNLKWISLNDKFCEIIGYSREALKYLNPKIITYPDDYISDLIALDKLVRGVHSTYTKENRYIHKQGHLVWVRVTVTLFRDSTNEPLYLISIVQDISANKRAEQELLFKNNELDTFIYKASHDLKGPVASLLGVCNLVQFEVKDKMALRYFNKVHDQALRMNTIISSLTEIGKIKDLDPQAESINFDELINNSINALSTLPYFDTIEFKILNRTLHEFHSDKNIISIIFHNLIENAIKYKSPEQDSYISIQIEEVKKGVGILITDNGLGIPQEIEDKIFNMFFRGTEHSKGSGLGLYITKSAVEKLNGTIKLMNKTSGLTELNIYLPNLKSHSRLRQ